MPQAHFSQLTLKRLKIAGALTDFPILVSLTSVARLKTIGNGGHVNNVNGYDIRPYSDSGLTTALTYELTSYNASTGDLLMWVKMPTLTNNMDTPIYLGYGDTSLTTDGSSSATWSNGFLGVYHLGNGTTLSVASSTGSNNGTNNGATATASGQINGAANFAAASNQWVDLGTGMNPSAITVSAWVKATSFPNAYNNWCTKNTGSAMTACAVKSNGKLSMYVKNTGGTTINYDGTGANTLTSGTMYFLVLTYDSTNGLKGYLNAAVDGSVGANGTLNTTATTFAIGDDRSGPGTSDWNGLIDEVRIASVARAAAWLTTEYNNQLSPSTFHTLETEDSVVTIVPPWVPNMRTISTAHANGTFANVINQVISGRRFSSKIFYIPTANALGDIVVLPNAIMTGMTYDPEPSVGATTVTFVRDDATGWTSGN